LTANELAEPLAVSRIAIFKQAKAGRIPSFRIGTCVRFDPKSVAQWLRPVNEHTLRWNDYSHDIEIISKALVWPAFTVKHSTWGR
jgi:excisionase family DNA binding protein